MKHTFLDSIGIKIEELNGVNVMSINDFAKCTGKEWHYLYSLIARGNRYRKLRVVELLGKKFIPVAEFYDFVFVDKDKETGAYSFDVEGNKVYKD